MVIKSIEIEKFRAFEDVSFSLGKRITAIAGRNATQKTTVLGMIGQPFSISSKEHPMYGCKTIDGYNFKSQFKEKFKISPKHDLIGSHKWKLILHNNIYSKDYFSVASIARKQKGKATSLRFWNSESKASGAGYIQLPVYYLSLSRLFPIGESGKTTSIAPKLTPEELEYCIDNYRTILSIQKLKGNAIIGLEKGSASKVYSGISDGVHDIFTNSAGEGNITKILLAVLSFKRLKEQFPKDYKGGILLIDELDATLYGFSQEKLINYLEKAAGDFRIQIVFTTHSPIILKAVNKLHRREQAKKGVSLPPYAYDNAIVYLEPQYLDGTRMIVPKNISSSLDLSGILNDINLSVSNIKSKPNVYCEDDVAIAFIQYLLRSQLGINIDIYMNFVDINLGWSNYIQLYEKQVPEFRKNVIVLDGDVPDMKEYKLKRKTVGNAQNIIFMPLMVERDFFRDLKETENFLLFQNKYSVNPAFTYDICFNNWPLEFEKYRTEDYKAWYKHILEAIGNQEILFQYWSDTHNEKAVAFVETFTNCFNTLADINEVDALPPKESENTTSI